MKAKIDFKSLFGLTQLQISMLLGVTRSQWSHYVTGRRDLPSEASMLLSEMILHMVTLDSNALKKNMSLDLTRTKLKLEDALAENKIQLLKIARKIAMETQKHERYLRSVELTRFLTVEEQDGKRNLPRILKTITDGALQNFEISGNAFKLLVIREQELTFQKSLYEAEVKMLSRDSK